MSKVYVVTAGTYSDYHIEAIFTTKEVAQAFIDADSAQIEAWELFDALPKRVVWWAIDTISWEHGGKPFERSHVMWEFETPTWNGKPYRYERWGKNRRVFGTDKERVRKVFWDNWNRERAEQEGIG